MKLIKLLFPMFDEQISKDNKKFIRFLIVLSSLTLVFYLYKISLLLKPEFYQNLSGTIYTLFFFILLSFIPFTIFLITSYTIVFTVTISFHLPIIKLNQCTHTLSSQAIQPKLTYIETYTKQTTIMRCWSFYYLFIIYYIINKREELWFLSIFKK